MKITIEISRKQMLAIVGILLVASALIAYAAIRYTTPIMNSVTVNDDALSLVSSSVAYHSITSINWGAISKGSEKTTDDVFQSNRGQTITNNAGIVLYAGWVLNSTLPAGMTLTAYYYDDTNSQWQIWHPNTFSQFSSIAPKGSSPAVKWVLDVGEYVSSSIYNFEIDILAADSQQG